MHNEITELFSQNTIEISELQELADLLLFNRLLNYADYRKWYKFIDRLDAWAKLHGASILVHDDYIQQYLAESAASTMQDYPEDVRPFVDADAAVAFWIEHTVRKSCVYPEPIEGVSEVVWWCI